MSTCLTPDVPNFLVHFSLFPYARRSAVADIRIVHGDLESLAGRIDAVRDGVTGLDAAGAVSGAASAMPGSVSSGLVGAVAAGLDGAKAALGGQYGGVGSGVRNLVAIHRSNDGAVAAATPTIGTVAGQATGWAHAKGLD